MADFVNMVEEKVNLGMQVDQKTDTLWVSRGGDEDKVVVFNKELNAIKHFQCPEIGTASDLCLLPDNRVAVTCRNNSSNTNLIVVYWAKKDSWVKQKEFKKLEAIPSGICRLGEKFLAVNLRNGNTVIIDVDLNNVLFTILGSQSIEQNNGICCTKRNELVIGNYGGNKISVLKMEWPESGNGNTEWRWILVFDAVVESPGFLSYCQKTDRIFIASSENPSSKIGKKIVMFTHGGGNLWTRSIIVPNPLFDPWSVAIDETDPKILYVGNPNPGHLAKYTLH